MAGKTKNTETDKGPEYFEGIVEATALGYYGGRRRPGDRFTFRGVLADWLKPITSAAELTARREAAKGAGDEAPKGGAGPTGGDWLDGPS